MKYTLDISITIVLLIIVVWNVYKPLPSFSINSLSLEDLEGKSMTIEQTKLILHLSNIECQSCKRDTQILMRFHLKHPEYTIIDANILYKDTDKEKLLAWKKTIDIQYPLAIINNEDSNAYPIPTTLVVNGEETTKIFGALSHAKLLEATKIDR